MSKDLQAIKYLNDTCINFLDRTKKLYCTVTFTRKRAEILRDNIAEVEQALLRLEAIDNSNPSEALETLKDMLIGNGVNDNINDYVDNLILPVKQALLKGQDPKKYLKWEDLEFKGEEQKMKVILNGSVHFLSYYRNMFSDNLCMIDNTGITIWKENKQFFNDLHLERVEE